MPIETSRRRAALPALALATALVAGGCETVQSTSPGAVGVTRTQRMAVSAEEVETAAAQGYRKMLQEAAAKGILNVDPVQVTRVRRISDRLVAQTVVYRPEAARWNWESNLFQTPEVNAFCMAGGKTGVYSGLLDRRRRTAGLVMPLYQRATAGR